MPSELQEAITAATASSASSLIQKYIDPLILEYVRRYSPVIKTIPSKQISTNVYYYVQRTALPDGGAVQDGGARPVATSTYTQPSAQIRNYQSVGAVTGFAQAVTAGLVGDLLRLETDGAMKNLLWAVETDLIWGNDAARANGVYPGTNGLDTLVNVYSGQTQNALDKTGANFALAQLDELIDLVEENAAQDITNDWFFILSPKMVSNVAQLLVANQRFASGGGDSANAPRAGAGVNPLTYRDIPLVKSSFLANRGNQMGAVSTATATTGGTLAAATYYYQVVPVINRFGCFAASTEVSQTTTGSTSTVTLSFSTPSGPDSNGPTQYKVYRSTSTGTETLLGVVDAFDTTGTATTSIVDTGTNLLTNSSGNTGPSAYVGGNSGQKPPASGQEEIFLVPKTPDFMCRPYVRDIFMKPLAQTSAAPDTLPFYVQTDTALAVRGPKYVGRLSRVVANI